MHAVDDGVVHRQPGVPIEQHLLAVAVALSLAVSAMVMFPILRPGARASIAAIIGILTLVNGSMHLIGILMVGIGGSDLTGVLAALAGALLIAIAGAVLVVHRNRDPDHRMRRWLIRGTAAAIAILTVPGVLFPLSVAIVETHTFREPITARPGPSYKDVTFRATDGIRLSGWYSPSQNGAAVVLVNSTRGDRNGSVAHARLIAAHGYGVLLYDARGTGRSEGDPNGFGWDWGNDIGGAASFLADQPDVRDRRIGALGLSTGADALLGMGKQGHRLEGIVADGATARSVGDIPDAGPVTTTSFGILFSTMKLLSGEGPGPPLRQLVSSVAPTPLLLIASGSIPQELPANKVYARNAREPVDLWELPGIEHTAAIRQIPRQYEQRVIGFFDRALLHHPARP